MLEFMEDEQIFEVELNPDKTKLVITEACDYHYNVDITKSQLLKLINDLQALADQMVDTKK